MLEGTSESPPEIPHKSRRTLTSPQECEIARGSPNQLEIKPDSLHWIQSNSLFPIMHEKWLDFLYAFTEIPGDTRLTSIGTPILAQELEESSKHPKSS